MQIKLNLIPIHSAGLFIQVLLDAADFRSTCYKGIWANKFKRLTCVKFRFIISSRTLCSFPVFDGLNSVPAVYSTSIKTEIRGQAQKKHEFVLWFVLIWPILLQSVQVEFSLQLLMGTDRLTRRKRPSTKRPKWTYRESRAFWKKMGDLRNDPYRSQSRLSLDPRTNESSMVRCSVFSLQTIVMLVPWET